MKKTNLVGALVMALLILIALPLGVHTSFTRLREEVAWEFYGDDAGFAIYDSIETREDAAHNMVTIAEKYTNQYPQLVDLASELEYWATASERSYSDTYQEEAEANRQMSAAAQALYQELRSVQLEERDLIYPDQLMAQMESEQDKIDRSSYNDKARAYNEKLSAFPFNLLRGIAGVPSMATFDSTDG